MQPVADGVYVYTESDGSQDPATVSSLVVVTEEGVLVADGLGHLGDPHESDVKAQKLIDEIRRLTDQPIKYLINCSWHPDHTTGNHLFPDAGALIVGHRKARQGLLQYYERATDIPKTTPHMVTYEDSPTLFLGDKEARVSFLGRVYTERWNRNLARENSGSLNFLLEIQARNIHSRRSNRTDRRRQSHEGLPGCSLWRGGLNSTSFRYRPHPGGHDGRPWHCPHCCWSSCRSSCRPPPCRPAANRCQDVVPVGISLTSKKQPPTARGL